MGGCCFGNPQKMRKNVYEKALQVFRKISLPDKNYIDRQAIEDYFPNYSQSCYDILMREMDFNKDGIITQNQWISYWEYIRVAGYDLSSISKELNRIQKGEVTLSFPRAKEFQPNQPRITLLNNILTSMQADTTTIPFLQNLPSQTNSNLNPQNP